jgi:hypothetical protein
MSNEWNDPQHHKEKELASLLKREFPPVLV